MEFKDRNLLNIYNPGKTVDADAIAGIAFAMLPSAYVAKTIESALVYLLFALIYFILSTLAIKGVQKFLPEKINFMFATFSFVAVAIFVSLLARAFFVTFYDSYSAYLVLISVSALPYMLEADNEEKSVHGSLLNALHSFIGFAIIMLLIAIFREVVGTGMIHFGKYTNIEFTVDLFSKYALSVFNQPLGAFIMLAFIIAVVKGRGDVE